MAIRHIIILIDRPKGKTIFQQIAIAKLIHDLWNTGKQKVLFGQDEEGLCPVCKEHIETMDHVLQCQHEDTTVIKTQLMEDLREALYKGGTPNSVAEGLMTGITWWIQGAAGDTCPRAPGYGKVYGPEVLATAAYAEQTKMGWGQLLRGRMSKLWGEAVAKYNNGSNFKETSNRWSKLIIWSLWKVSLGLWTNRNEVLHGKTLTEQEQRKQEAVNTTIQEAYQIYDQENSIVAAADRYLFAQPVEELILKQYQYKLCWMRSVTTVRHHQKQELEKLRRQAARFFGAQRPESLAPENNIETESVVAHCVTPNGRQIPMEDIASPQSYNLRRRRWAEASSDEESDGYIIPPAMFEELLDSSYDFSDAPDVILQFDTPITQGEAARLLDSTTESTYGGSSQTDTTLSNWKISSEELMSLAQTLRSSMEKTPEDDNRYQSPSPPWNPPNNAATNRVSTFLVGTQDYAPCSSTATSEWELPAFPLQKIGAINETEVEPEGLIQTDLLWSSTSKGEDNTIQTSTSGHTADNMANTTTISPNVGFFVYGEYRGTAESPIIRLGQDSCSVASSLAEESTMSSSNDTAQLNRNLYRLILRARQWLLSAQPRNYERLGVTPSVYWAVRSLEMFYDDNITSATAGGLQPLPVIYEEEWPDEPTGDDSYRDDSRARIG
mmetsp:Transcript_7234/g.10503  ORF Transcript_7234/g.10503 Transcript_7234/m.10503 type:complete len:666 (-) Transcript_7234:216-2213(-)